MYFLHSFVASCVAAAKFADKLGNRLGRSYSSEWCCWKWLRTALGVEVNFAFVESTAVPPSSAHNKHMHPRGVTERRPNGSERISLLLPLPPKLSVLIGGGMIIIISSDGGIKDIIYLGGRGELNLLGEGVNLLALIFN